MFEIKCYCAGILVLREVVGKEGLPRRLVLLKEELKRGNLSIHFGSGQTSTVTELCVDVYEGKSGKYRSDLSTAFK